MTTATVTASWWTCKPCGVRWKEAEPTTCWCCGASPVGSTPPHFPGFSGLGLF